MKKSLLVLGAALTVFIGVAFAGIAFAQSAADLEKAKAAGESMKEKMGTSGDQKTAPAAAPAAQPAPKEGPCKQIHDTCKSAGFVEGERRRGDGLYADCVNPIMQHKTVVPNATKPLPAVDPKLVADCKKRNPSFGAGPVGSPKHK
jgi:hypothetical protein